MHWFVLTLALGILPADLAAAKADRAEVPLSEWGYCFYLSTSHLVGEERAKCEAALPFVVASCSRQTIVERCTPVPVAEGLYRIRLDDLGWDWRQWGHVVAAYPYATTPGKLQLVYRADWLIVTLADTTHSDAYYRLLYGTAELNREQFLEVHGVSKKAEHHFGVIVRSEHPLGPSVAGLRLVENRDTDQRGSAWGTRDSAKITAKSDPTEHLAGDFEHDAEEWIVSMPKISLRTGERGTVFGYLLANGKGVRQEEAPPAIVTDHLGFRNQAAIRNWGSCVGCHASGFLDPGVSELRQLIAGKDAGVDVYAYPKALAEQIERFHLSDAALQIKRDNEDYAAGLRLINGLDGPTNAECFRAAIDDYDRDVDLATAAAETYTTPAELRLAIANYNQQGARVSARLAALADNIALPRTRWEEEWIAALLAVQSWEAGR